MSLEEFVKESNRIERILRAPSPEEIRAHVVLISGQMTISRMEAFVAVIAPGKPLRRERGMDVCVGRHVPPGGGPEIEQQLSTILRAAYQIPERAFEIHRDYETLHPFMDGNGRSGRALWLWMMGGPDEVPLGFLHTWYYQSLQTSRP